MPERLNVEVAHKLSEHASGANALVLGLLIFTLVYVIILPRGLTPAWNRRSTATL